MSRLLRCVLVFLLAAGALALAPVTSASAATTAPVTGLEARAGYNSVVLTWDPPADTTNYRGVSIWRYEGNRSDAPPPVLVAKLDQTRTSYTDSGLTVPSSGLWAYTVYTRDAVKGGIAPQYASDWMTAAMSGRVTDAHGNGVANVLVNVGPHAWEYGEQVRTAADGTWLADGLTDSSAEACFNTLDASGGTSLTGYQPQCWSGVASLPGYGPQGQTAALAVGALTGSINVTLLPAGSVSGTIRDKQGRALANAGVTVQRSDGKVRRLLVTGADGSYRAAGLMPGRYTSCAYQPFAGPAITPASATGFLGTCSDGTVDGEGQPKDFAVAAGAGLTTNITLAAGGVISGRLLGPDGRPVVGQEPTVDGTYAYLSRATETDATGAYTVTGLRTGTYTVCFRGTPSTGVGTGFDPGRAPRCWNDTDTSSPTPVNVVRGQWTKGVTVQEFANPTIAGRVTDTAGQPVGNVLVEVDNSGAVATAADGTYRLGVPPGTHTVCFDASQAQGASLSGYVDQCWKHQAQPGGTPTPVVLARGANITGVDASLKTAAGVRVQVVDAAGTPLRHTLVFLYDDQGDGPNDVTDDTGTVTFTRVYLGHGSAYSVYLSSDSYWNTTPTAPNGYATTQRAVRSRPG